MIAFIFKLLAVMIIVVVIASAFGSAFDDYNKVISGSDRKRDTGRKYINSAGFDDDPDDLMDDFIMPRDAMSIARGENPLDPEAQWKSITDPLDLFGDD